jgi:tetratricopeptide (TPR) repeat protein
MRLGVITIAEDHLVKSIQLDPLDAISYFMLGLIELDKKNPKTAATLLQKALYLKKDFIEAAYYLGLIHLQNENTNQGLKSIKQALIYAQETQNKESVVLGGHNSMAQLIVAMESTLSFHQPRKRNG